MKYDPKNPDENTNQLQGHWEKYANKRYMGASALFVSTGNYRTINIEIVGFYSRVVFDKATNQGKRVNVLALKGKEEVKEMILNTTNMQRIESYLGTPEVKEWPGKKINLGAEFVNSGNGKKVWALRVILKSK